MQRTLALFVAQSAGFYGLRKCFFLILLLSLLERSGDVPWSLLFPAEDKKEAGVGVW